MHAHPQRNLALALLLAPWLAACGDGNGTTTDTSTTDTSEDPAADTLVTDTVEDTPVDTGTAWRWCAKSCTTSEGCCLASGRPCGEYPNKWTCDEVCMTAGCVDDPECAAWATAIGLPNAANYKCKTSHLYWTAGYCVPGCTTEADCCPSGTDCSAYPQRRLCDAGGCRVDGCTGDAECQTWATGLGLPDAAGFVCHTFEYSDTATCAHPCASASDCCPGGSCGTFPNHADCIAGHCLATCTDDGECRDWAVANLFPDPTNYVCHTF
jgi:hypothetical protein